MWGCFAFLMGLEHVNATPSSRKIPFVDINRRYVRSVGRLTFFWEIWPGKMLAEARANGFLRTRGLTYRRFLSTVPCFFEKKGGGKSVGKRRARGATLPLHGVLRQVVGLILLKIPIEQSHGVSHAWLLANMLGVKKSHVAHRFRGR